MCPKLNNVSLYSPDFGPIECCFKFIDDILQLHHLRIDEDYFLGSIEAAFDSISALNVCSYMANAHISVPNYPFSLYMGQQ
jgi:hypothetical protein